MAKKQKSKQNISPSPVRMAVKLRTVITPDTPVYYSNFADVVHSKYDFVLTFTRAPAKLSPKQTELAKNDENIDIEAQVQVIIPSGLVDGLISALQTEKERAAEDEPAPQVQVKVKK